MSPRPDRPGRLVTVPVHPPVHPGDPERGTLAAMVKQAGLTRDEFLELL